MERIKYITAGSFIDGSSGGIHRNVFLEVKGGIISGIGKAQDLNLIDGSLIDDFSKYTIVPPLVDCSVSLTRSPSVEEKVRVAVEEGGVEEKNALLAQHISYCLAHGVLGLADSNENNGQSDQIEASLIDIRTATDFLRIDYSGSIGNIESTDSRLTLEDLVGILQQRGDKKAIVVANGKQRVQEAITAGCDAIELGYGMGKENLRMMSDKDVLWVPSVLMAQNAIQGAGSGGDVMCRFSMRYVAPGKPDPGAEAFWKKMLTEQLAQLHLARELGVRTAIGTGAGAVGIIHGESVVEEIKLFIKAGYSLAEAIRSASEIGAGFFGMDGLGRLTVGRPATFLVARGTAQQLPRKLAHIERIYINGGPVEL